MREDWVEVELGEVSQSIQYGYTESSSDKPIGPKFLRITDIQDNNVDWNTVPYCKIRDEKLSNYLLKRGDLLFARTGATVGKSFLIKSEIPSSVFASYLIRVRVNNLVLNENFLSYFFYSPFYWQQITEGQVGIGQPNVNGTKLGKLNIPIPPLPIQRAIVRKIETLFASLDKGIADLKTAQEQLKVYRQAVLKKAFEGEYPKKKVFEFADVNTGSTPKRGNLKYWENGTIPWVTSGALNNSFVNKSAEYITETALQETNCKIISKGSLLVAMYGEGKTRGKCSELNIDAATNQAIATITMFVEFVNSKSFVKWFFIKNYEEIRLLSSGGVQPNLNLSIISNTVLPFPSPDIQKQIIKEIESRLSVCDKVEQSIAEALEKAEALRQSILKKAFEGKLLSAAEIARCKQEADYEPASTLLARIERSRNERIRKEKKNGK